MHFLFVYGTLKKGGIYHPFLKNITAIQAVALKIDLHIGSHYSFAKRGKGKIIGEVYRINSTKLIEIDHLEGHPNQYHRELTHVMLANGRTIKAWVYLNPFAARRCPLIERKTFISE